MWSKVWSRDARCVATWPEPLPRRAPLLHQQLGHICPQARCEGGRGCSKDHRRQRGPSHETQSWASLCYEHWACPSEPPGLQGGDAQPVRQARMTEASAKTEVGADAENNRGGASLPARRHSVGSQGARREKGSSGGAAFLPGGCRGHSAHCPVPPAWTLGSLPCPTRPLPPARRREGNECVPGRAALRGRVDGGRPGAGGQAGEWAR